MMPIRLVVQAPQIVLQMCATLDLYGPVNQNYRIEYTTALNSAWIALTNLVAPTSPYTYVDLSSRGQPQRFYRAIPTP